MFGTDWVVAIILILVCTPAGFILLFYFIRLIVVVLAKLYQSIRYDAIITGLELIFLNDSLYESPLFTVGGTFRLQGQVDQSHFNKEFHDTFILQSRNSNYHAFNRLRQYPEQFLGYKFWTWDLEFELSSHIEYLHGSRLVDVSKFIASLLTKPFTPKRPLWKIYIISYRDYSLLVFIFHHGLMDAQSASIMLKSASRIANSDNLNLNRQPTELRRRTLIQKINHVSHIPIQVLRDLRCVYDTNNWLEKLNPANVNSRDVFVASTSKFNLIDFVQIKHDLEVSLTSLFLTAIAAGLGDYVTKYLESGQTPKFISMFNPMPLPNHPEQLINHFTFSPLRMKIQTSASLLDRIKSMNKEYLRSKESIFPYLFQTLIALESIFPIYLFNKISPSGRYKSLFSNVGFLNNPGDWFGQEVEEIKGVLGRSTRPRFSFVLLSYNQYFEISVSGESSFIQEQEQLDLLCSLITNELQSILSEFRTQ